MHVYSDYTGDARILLVPAAGQGKSHLKLENFNITIKMKAGLVEKDSKEYLVINKIKIEFSVSRFWMQFDNLFNGNKQLGDTFNEFLNENWEEIYKEFISDIRNKLETQIKKIINNFFAKNPYRDLFYK